MDRRDRELLTTLSQRLDDVEHLARKATGSDEVDPHTATLGRMRGRTSTSERGES